MGYSGAHIVVVEPYKSQHFNFDIGKLANFCHLFAKTLQSENDYGTY